MTRDEIELTPAGITLDWHIAHFVMRLPNKELTLADCPCAYCGNQMRYCGARSWCSDCHEWRYTAYKDYSDDLVSAWEVVEELENHPNEILFDIVRKGADHQSLKWCATFREVKGRQKYYYMEADTTPLAICRAALLAVLDAGEKQAENP